MICMPRQCDGSLVHDIIKKHIMSCVILVQRRLLALGERSGETPWMCLEFHEKKNTGYMYMVESLGIGKDQTLFIVKR